jgi:Zn-dependent protease
MEGIASGDWRNLIIQVLLMIPVVLIALSAHEAAHGAAAYLMGDRTAYALGRVTLNPAKHLDPIGTFVMLVFGFGWAKPVPINARNFRNPKWGMALTAIAGPLSNLLLGIIGAILTSISFFVFYAIIPIYAPQMLETTYYEALQTILILLFEYFGLINFIYAFFNLIPLPPFDGSRFFFTFLPLKWYFGIMKYERYIMFGVLILFMLSSRIFNFSPVSFLAEISFSGITNSGIMLLNILYQVITGLIF